MVLISMSSFQQSPSSELLNECAEEAVATLQSIMATMRKPYLASNSPMTSRSETFISKVELMSNILSKLPLLCKTFPGELPGQDSMLETTKGARMERSATPGPSDMKAFMRAMSELEETLSITTDPVDMKGSTPDFYGVSNSAILSAELSPERKADSAHIYISLPPSAVTRGPSDHDGVQAQPDVNATLKAQGTASNSPRQAPTGRAALTHFLHDGTQGTDETKVFYKESSDGLRGQVVAVAVQKGKGHEVVQVQNDPDTRMGDDDVAENQCEDDEDFQAIVGKSLHEEQNEMAVDLHVREHEPPTLVSPVAIEGNVSFVKVAPRSTMLVCCVFMQMHCMPTVD